MLITGHSMVAPRNNPDSLPDRPGESENDNHGFDTGPFGILTLAVYMGLVVVIAAVVVPVLKKLFFNAFRRVFAL